VSTPPRARSTFRTAEKKQPDADAGLEKSVMVGAFKEDAHRVGVHG
jgi:hypothetical protein